MSNSVEVRVPFENVNDTSARLIVWEVRSGSTVAPGQLLCRLETTKAIFDVCAPVGGRLRCEWAEGTEIPVGDVLARIETSEGAPPNDKPVSTVDAPAAKALRTVFSRKGEALLAQLGLARELFDGMGMVGEAEVKAVAAKTRSVASSSQPSPTKTPLVDPRVESFVPLERTKVYENRELLAADRAVLRSTLHVHCPAANLAEVAARRDPPVSRLALVLFEVARSLRDHPGLNASFREDHVARFREIDLGFAVDMGRGLKVLVIRRTDTLSLERVHDSIEDLLVKYATDSLSFEDVNGSTFTVTDLSAEGVFCFDPLLNRDQAAILGLGAGAAGHDSGWQGLMLSCAFDHRVLGGKEVAAFLGSVSRGLAAVAPRIPTAQASEPPLCSLCLRGTADLRPLRAAMIPSVEPPGYVCSICFSGLG